MIQTSTFSENKQNRKLLWNTKVFSFDWVVNKLAGFKYLSLIK